MSDGNQPRDTVTEDALLQLQALHLTHSEETRLFFMTIKEGVTDAQIADASRQGLPHLIDPASLQDRRAVKEPEGTVTSEKDNQPAAQKKRTSTTTQDPTPQPALLATDETFAAALEPFLPTTGAGLGRLAGRSC